MWMQGRKQESVRKLIIQDLPTEYKLICFKVDHSELVDQTMTNTILPVWSNQQEPNLICNEMSFFCSITYIHVHMTTEILDH